MIKMLRSVGLVLLASCVSSVLLLAGLSGCQSREIDGADDLASRGSGSLPIHVLIVASRDDHADLNIILTWTPARGFVLQTLQRDYAMHSKIPGCKPGLKLTDNLAAASGSVAQYKSCIEGMMGSYYKALKSKGGADAKEQRLRLGADSDLRISQVFQIDLDELNSLIQAAMKGFGFIKPQSVAEWQKAKYLYDSYEVSCGYFGNMLNFLTGSTANRDYLCKGSFLPDLAASLVTKTKSDRLNDLFETLGARVKLLKECLPSKIRERGSDVSELKVRTCVGHVAPDVAGSYQREFNGATLVGEVLGYVSVFRRVKPDAYRSMFEAICAAVECRKSGRYLNFMALDEMVGTKLADPKYFWKGGYSPIPIIVWDGIFDDGGRPSVPGWGGEGQMPPSHAMFLAGRATYFDTEGRSRGGDCGAALLSQLICYVAYPSKDKKYEGRVGKDGGWSWGYLPWMIPPPSKG